MNRKSYLTVALSGLTALILTCCIPQEPAKVSPVSAAQFDPGTLKVHDNNTAKKIRGQVLYLPVYSNVPYFEQGKKFDLTAFVAIHNTDLNHPLIITKVLFFDNDGKLISDYLTNEIKLLPLAATNFFVPEKDKSGTGANFIVEWVADTLISEPLVESVMVGLTGGQGVSFLSTGRIIRESK